MERAQEKAQRLLQIEQLLWAHPQGLTRAEIARRLGVHRSTITKYLAHDQLPRSIYEEADGRLVLDRAADLTRASFTLNEILAIHLATRLLATRTDRQNPHAASALRKLGLALERLDHNISGHLLRSADVMDEASAVRDPVYLDVLEKLTLAWSTGRKVHLRHQMADGSLFEYLFSPYLIEPYAVGQTAHVIGWREPPSALRTFKIERIRAVELTSDTYTIPSDFDPGELLGSAWGIWFSDAPPVQVGLRFHPLVASRVRETRWHPSQVLQEQPDGYILWKAQVAEPQEMLPWIRGWGADVEVLEPGVLRETLAGQARRMVALYQGVQVAPPSQPPLLRLWGKTVGIGATASEFHPALFHMLDAGHVASELLSERASPRWRRVLAAALGADQDSLLAFLPWWVALHDIGKVSSAFQSQNRAQWQRLVSEGLPVGNPSGLDLHHTFAGQVFMQFELETALPEIVRRLCRESIGAHHGRFADPSALQEARRMLGREAATWSAWRQEIAGVLHEHLAPHPIGVWPEPANISAAIMALTGFTILCDWLASDSAFFPVEPRTPLANYLPLSAARARQAVEHAGFHPSPPSGAPRDFAALFPGISPRPLQCAIDEVPAGLLSGPCLAIIEAPTSEGKTEAALALAHRLAAGNGSDEFYYALPTTATSNQMFGRLQTFLRQNLELSAQVKLIHSQAMLYEDDLRLAPLSNGDGQDPAAVLEWFGPRKRALLAPFGVGTIDQAELAALNVSHTALRMIGLAGKVLIVDEVHAYDTYMTTIVERLLNWCAALGTSVILLSATLPLDRRAALARAYAGEIPESETASSSYPRLSVVSPRGCWTATPPACQPERRIQLGWLRDSDLDAQAQWLLEAVSAGGCVCWITNTVARAQDIYRRVHVLAPVDCEHILLHAQYPLDERQRREQEITQKYGPGQQERPWRGIVIGTQVLEQSLDLDFDVLVSDLAPVDLLLQRAGRMHRHLRARPDHHTLPRLWVYSPQTPEGDPALGANQFIYPEYLLRQTARVLEGKDEIVLPADYRPLIEAVYAASPPDRGDPLAAAWNRLQAQEDNAMTEARARLLPAPDPEDAFCGPSARMTFEEREDDASWIVAQTRLGEPSVTVIPLEREGDAASVHVEGQVHSVDLRRAATRETQLQLLRASVRVSNSAAVEALKAQPDPPPLFTQSALLRRCYPLWLNAGQATLVAKTRTVHLTLDPLLGLVIAKGA